jgi:integrative and conjugative element protein (TIGR02256 family)
VIEYSVADSGQTIVFSDGVLDHVLANRQTKPWEREAGGQLFAHVSRYEIYIKEATGPRRSDKRSRVSYRPDRKLEQAEICDRQRKGLVFVGDWHTHPELLPGPSPRDLASISECFRRSSHDLNAFLLLVVGTSASPKDIHVSLHNAAGIVTQLEGVFSPLS